jgi:hypothetical protein
MDGIRELEGRLQQVIEANWQLLGRVNALEILSLATLAIIVASDSSANAKDRTLALVERLREVARGHPIDRQTPEGERSAQETSAAMEELLSHFSEHLDRLKPGSTS